MDGQTVGKIVTFTLPIEPFGQSPRKIWVYLPTSYIGTERTYPVLYMFDGHNLFSDKIATYGKSWGIKKYLDAKKLDLIVVGQDCNHTGNKRLDEYCPLPAVHVKGWEGIEPEGDITAEWFKTVLQPAVERMFRVKKGRKHAGIAGSSMGGLMAEYMAALYSDSFSRFGCISPANEFSPRDIITFTKKAHVNPDSRLYFSFGSEEWSGRKKEIKEIAKMLEVDHIFREKGCETYSRLIVNGEHNEATWEKIVPEMISYLFPEIY